jgi:hypothetical protein
MAWIVAAWSGLRLHSHSSGQQVLQQRGLQPFLNGGNQAAAVLIGKLPANQQFCINRRKSLVWKWLRG